MVSPFDGRGIRERAKVYKRRLECNFPLSLTLSRAGERGKEREGQLQFLILFHCDVTITSEMTYA